MSAYSLSFTGSAVRKPESILLARHYLNPTNPSNEGNWQAVSKAATQDNILMIQALSSRKRISSELIKRLRTLNNEELDYLLKTTPSEQNLVLWLAICRTYQFAEDFSREVIANRLKSSSNVIGTGVFENFYDEQASYYPKLLAISEKTHERMRNQFLQMLREVGLINEGGAIQQVYLSPELVSLLEKRGQDEYALYPTRF